MEVADKFNDCANAYKHARPSYPVGLFKWMASLTTEHKIALDCGTGNGQAALQLTTHFDTIIAVDSNQNQINEAPYHPNITYLCTKIEKLALDDKSINLIICASSAHWFALDDFYSFCNRALKEDGKIVCFTYTWPDIKHPCVQKILACEKKKINPFWSKGSLYHLNQYKTIPFPFQPIIAPNFQFKMYWTIEEIIQFFSTWACIKYYDETIDIHFLTNLHKSLKSVCHPHQNIECLFPLYIKAGKL